MRQLDHQVSMLLEATIDAQEEERERVCLEIHDGVAQTLAGAFQHQSLQHVPELSGDSRAKVRKAESLVREAIREAREVIGTLRPASLDMLGLVKTLRFELNEMASQQGWQVEFEADELRLPKSVETALYRIMHEAITNVGKHASARKVVVQLKHDGGCVSTCVQGGGSGFDPLAVLRHPCRGMGILSLRKRAELLGGSFEVLSRTGEGTLVRVHVPLRREGNHDPNRD